MHRLIAVAVCLGATLAFPNPDADNNNNGQLPDTLITTPSGQVRGSTLTSRLGKTIYAYRGIRYAKAPINDLRFKPPVPADKWEGILNATKDGPLCPQPTSDPVSEDCLILNVYINKVPEGSERLKRPVIVYIHGGAFYGIGSTTKWLGPQYLLDQNIVLVTFNYRLATLGFLSTNEKEAPGNNGLKDQVEVLKWVRKNIEAFGGDPTSVTIMGNDFGAWSVVLHMVSPMSQGLFHKAIAMSGSPLGIWPIPLNQLEVAKKQARLVNCPDDTAANIIKCLKTKPVDDLSQSLPKFKEFGNDPVYIWSPVIESDHGQPRFLPAHPVNLITSGQFQKVPFLTGQNNDEFADRAFLVVNNETLLKDLNENFEKIAPIAFGYERETEHSKQVSKDIRTFYLQEKPADKTQVSSLAQVYGDALVGFAVNRAARLIADHSNQSVYYYKFGFQGQYSHYYTQQSNNTQTYGVVHNDELIYLFHMPKLFPLLKEDAQSEIGTLNKLTTLIYNFAKSGNPIPTPTEKLDNVKWETFNSKDQKYLDIGNKLTVHEKLFEKRFNEWEKLYPLSIYQKNKHSH